MITAATSVEARLRALEDEGGVLATMYQYGHALDYGLRDEFLDCFTRSGVWDSRRCDSGTTPVGHYAGHAQLAGFFDRHTHAPSVYHKHLLVEPRITIDGDLATAASYFVRVDEHGGEVYMPGFGRYQDRLVRSADGRWRFEERRVELERWQKREPVVEQ
jgi:hypothetical protein